MAQTKKTFKNSSNNFQQINFIQRNDDERAAAAKVSHFRGDTPSVCQLSAQTWQ